MALIFCIPQSHSLTFIQNNMAAYTFATFDGTHVISAFGLQCDAWGQSWLGLHASKWVTSMLKEVAVF